MSEITNKPGSRMIALGAASCLAVAGALALGASPAASAPLGANVIALKEAAPGYVVDVHRRGHRSWGKYAVAGLALGFLGGALAPHWWGGHSHYPHASFGYGYYPAYNYYPAFGYYPPVRYYSPRRCWTGWGWAYC
jgi:hypothetical protein